HHAARFRTAAHLDGELALARLVHLRHELEEAARVNKRRGKNVRRADGVGAERRCRGHEADRDQRAANGFHTPPPVVCEARRILPSCPVTTVFSAFEQTARAHGSKPFLQVPSERLELTYAQAFDRISTIARIYARSGYGAG